MKKIIKDAMNVNTVNIPWAQLMKFATHVQIMLFAMAGRTSVFIQDIGDLQILLYISLNVCLILKVACKLFFLFFHKIIINFFDI